MSIPRSTLVTGAIALFSTSALIYVLLYPTAPPINPLHDPVAEEVVPITPAQPGQLNPIAAKVLAEGGPRTPNTTTSSSGPRRGSSRFRLAMDQSHHLGTCLQDALTQARLLAGEFSGEVLTCQGSGPLLLEAQLVLATTPVPVPGDPKARPTQARCSARISGTLSSESRSLPLSMKPDPMVGSLENPCDGLEPALTAALLQALDKKL